MYFDWIAMPIPLILIWEVSRRGSIYACMTYLVNSFRCFYSLFLMLLPFQTVKTKFVVMKSESFVLWVKLSAWWWRSMNWWTWCCSAHLYSWLYRWIFATTLKLKKSYVNSSFSSCFFIRRRPSEMEYSPSFPFQNTKQFWIRILSERTRRPSCLMMRNTRRIKAMTEIRVSITQNCLFDGNLFYY